MAGNLDLVATAQLQDMANAINGYRNEPRADGYYEEADALRDVLLNTVLQ